jgi:hypothetical protein
LGWYAQWRLVLSDARLRSAIGLHTAYWWAFSGTQLTVCHRSFSGACVAASFRQSSFSGACIAESFPQSFCSLRWSHSWAAGTSGVN